MQQLLRLISIVGLLLAASFNPPSAASQPAPSRSSMPASAVADQYIVVVRSGRDVRAVARTAGVTPQHVYARVFNGFVAKLAVGQRTALQRHPDVTLIEPDQVVEATSTQTIDPTSGVWGLDRIDQRTLPLDGQYRYTTVGAGVTAYIIDSGLQVNHPEFGTRAQNVYDAFGGNGADCNGHGTHLAGIVGGVTYGVAKQVTLRGVRVLDCDALGTVSNAIRGIDWVAANAVKPAVATIAFSPVNLSNSNSGTLQLAVENLIASGMFVAVSAGNGNVDACSIAPANVAAAFTVAASTRTDSRSSFSNHGSCVDSYAPGSGITSAWINSTTNTASGTSQATAFVAGAAALYKAAHGDAAQATINTWLTTHATLDVIQGNVSGTPNRLLYLLPLVGGFSSINAGYWHSCGVRTDNTLVCWGDNGVGQSTPPAGTFLQVSAGYSNTCGLRTNNTVACWGDIDGQTNVPSGSFLQVSAGRHHSCGVRTDNTLACWGYNEFGQATVPSGLFLQVGVGRHHSCGVRTDNTLACWGLNSYGVATPPSGTFSQVSVGRFHTCGLRTNNTVACWGDNSNGQASTPGDSFLQVSAGILHSCGIRTDGTIACWGDNEFGQASAPSGTFSQVAVGYYHTCGLRTNNTVVCWGDTSHGQTLLPPN
jgi:alpha-tubulin suppressor-like RCC1 family protein